MSYLTEEEIEQYQLELLQDLGYQLQNGSTIPFRYNLTDVILKEQLQKAIAQLNPTISPDIQQQAFNSVTNINSSDLINNNERFHRYLTEGVTIDVPQAGETRGEIVRLIDWNNPQ